MSLTAPAEDVMDLVRTEDRNRPLRELLNLTPRALLGVSPDAEEALKKLEIMTVFDLATSALFDNAIKLVNSASDFKSALFQHGSPTADMIKEAEIAGKKLSELQFLPIRVLESVPEADADSIATALDVATVRELALYPPYRAAQQILSTAYFPENEAGYDPETPPDLRPRTGEYPTERVQYATLLMDEIVTVPGVHFTDLQSSDFKPIDITRLSEADAGFKEIAFGALLTFNQSWYAQGVTLGQLLHSIALAPGESTRIAVVDWSRKSRAGETEIISETEDLISDTSRNRSISEVTQAVANEAQGGFSKANTNSLSLQSAESRAGEDSGGLVGAIVGGSSSSWGTSNAMAIGMSYADSYSTSSGHRDIGSTMQQNIIDRTQQHAHASRSRRASVVKEVSQSEHENVSTRVLTNYNHMHALTIQYYEVVQVYRVEVAIVKADKVIFIPIALVDFNNDDTVRRFRDVLARRALTYDIHDALRNLDVIEITPDEDVHFVPLNNNLKSYTREAVFDSRAVGMARAVNPSAVQGNSDVTSSSAASVNMIAQQQRLSVVLPAIQQINERLWTAEQMSRLSSLLGRMTLRPDSTALYLPTDVTLEGAVVSGGDVPLTAVFYKRQGGSVKEVSASSPLALSDVSRIAISGSSASNDISATVTMTVNRNGVRFPVDLPAVKIAKGTPGETRVALVKPGGVNANLKQHLNDNKLYYSQVVYRSLDSTQIALLLSGYALQVDDKMIPVSQLIEPRPIRYVGNYLAFTMNSDPQNDKVWAEWLQTRGIHLGETGEDIVPLPSGGTFAEAVLGRFNCAEQLDITRFWNWQDSPIPLQPTEIAAIQTGSRATQENVTPGQLSSPIVYIQQPTALPDPTGTAAVLSAIQNGNMFRDMSGLQATIGLAQAALQATAAGAATAGQQAGTNMQNQLQAQTERMRIAADLAKAVLSAYTGVPMGGSSSGGPGSGRNVSHDGAKVNYFDKQKAAASGRAGTASSGASSVGSGSSSLTGAGTSGTGGLNGATGTSGSGTTNDNISNGTGYSQNPGILAATWGGDSQPRSALTSELVNTAFTSAEPPSSVSSAGEQSIVAPYPGSEREPAHIYLEGFSSNTTSGAWKLSRADVAAGLDDLINYPDSLDQDGLNLCGPASFLRLWIERDPLAFAIFAADLYENGSSHIGSYQVKPGSDLRNQDYTAIKARVEANGGIFCREADWMIMSALRDSENSVWDYEGTPEEDISAATSPETIAKWLRATGLYLNVRAEGNFVFTKGLAHATSLLPTANRDVILLINASILPNSSPHNFITQQFPDHYIVLTSPIVVTDDKVQLPYWCWGGRNTLPVPKAKFEANYYGAVIADTESQGTVFA